MHGDDIDDGISTLAIVELCVEMETAPGPRAGFSFINTNNIIIYLAGHYIPFSSKSLVAYKLA